MKKGRLAANVGNARSGCLVVEDGNRQRLFSFGEILIPGVLRHGKKEKVEFCNTIKRVVAIDWKCNKSNTLKKGRCFIGKGSCVPGGDRRLYSLSARHGEMQVEKESVRA